MVTPPPTRRSAGAPPAATVPVVTGACPVDPPAPGDPEAVHPLLPFGLWLAVTLGWGLNFPAMKVILASMDPWHFRAVALMAGAAGLFAIAWLGRLPLRLPPGQAWPVIWASLGNITGWHLFSAYGLAMLPSGRAILIGYTMPVWASLLAVVTLGECFTPRRAVGLVLSVAGIGVLLWPDRAELWRHPAGVLCMLAAAITWAWGTTLLKRPWAGSMIVITAWMFLVGGLPIALGSLARPLLAPWGSLSGELWAALAYVIALPILFCHWAYNRLVTLWPVSRTGMATLATPMVGVVAGSFWLGEELGPSQLGSLALVTAALALVLTEGRQRLVRGKQRR